MGNDLTEQPQSDAIQVASEILQFQRELKQKYFRTSIFIH